VSQVFDLQRFIERLKRPLSSFPQEKPVGSPAYRLFEFLAGVPPIFDIACLEPPRRSPGGRWWKCSRPYGRFATATVGSGRPIIRPAVAEHLPELFADPVGLGGCGRSDDRPCASSRAHHLDLHGRRHFGLVLERDRLPLAPAVACAERPQHETRRLEVAFAERLENDLLGHEHG